MAYEICLDLTVWIDSAGSTGLIDSVGLIDSAPASLPSYYDLAATR